jgi:hypothetical protein
MPVTPNHQKLIVTNKQLPLSSGNYRTDMRTIEQWANEGIVRKIIAGTNVTTSPADGVDEGQGVTINATGGGGGATPGYGVLTAMMDEELWPFALFLGATGTSSEGSYQLGPLYGTYPLGTPSEAEGFFFGTSWVVETGEGGLSVNVLPIWDMPSFTNAGSDPIEIEFFFGATDLSGSFTNYGVYEGLVNLTSGESYQTQLTDLTPLFGGVSGDLSLVAGTGLSGNGLVSEGGSVLYLASVTGRVGIPAGTTFP